MNRAMLANGCGGAMLLTIGAYITLYSSSWSRVSRLNGDSGKICWA